MRYFLLAVCLGAMIISSSGCVAVLAGAAGGAGTAAWLSGKLVHQVDASMESSLKAVKSALKLLGYPVTKEAKTAEVIQVKSTYTDGKTIWIDIRYVSNKRSSISVRVGAISDRDAARKIIDKIEKYL